MSEKRFEVSFDEKIIVDTYGVNKNTTEYDIHKSCDLINSLYEENEQLIQKKCLSCELVNLQTREIDKLKEENDNCKNDYRELFSNYVALEEQNKQLMEENKKLKGLIKGNVFGEYREGSLVDLEFKAIAYDEIIKLEMSYESEPKVIVICKQGKKENVKSFCQIFIPLGVYYEIKEVNE